MLLGIFGEGLLLALVPVLVEASLDLITQMLRPDSGERPKAPRSLDVSNQTYNNHLGISSATAAATEVPSLRAHRWCLDDGNGLNDFLLVHLRTRPIQITDDCTHAGLIPHGRSEVNGLLRVILGERLDLSSVSARPLSWQEGK